MKLIDLICLKKAEIDPVLKASELNKISIDLFRFMLMGFSKEEDWSLATYLKKSVARSFSRIKDSVLKKELFSRFKKD